MKHEKQLMYLDIKDVANHDLIYLTEFSGRRWLYYVDSKSVCRDVHGEVIKYTLWVIAAYHKEGNKPISFDPGTKILTLVEILEWRRGLLKAPFVSLR